MVCDHVNHDGLDDCKANLRNCTIAQNNANRRSAAGASSKYIGVSRDKRRNKWVAHIKIHGEEKYLGSFDVEEDAARAYDAAAWAAHGPFANLNFPQDYPDHPANRFVARASPPAEEIPSTAEDAEGRRGNGTQSRLPTTGYRQTSSHREPREICEQDAERRVGLAPPRPRAKTRRAPRRTKTGKGGKQGAKGRCSLARRRRDAGN